MALKPGTRVWDSACGSLSHLHVVAKEYEQRPELACRYHAEAVALFETMDSQMKLNPDSWAYAHTVMSYVKDATGLFRRPQTEAAMRNALRATFHQCVLFLCIRES